MPKGPCEESEEPEDSAFSGDCATAYGAHAIVERARIDEKAQN
jgi:hypothetical protein